MKKRMKNMSNKARAIRSGRYTPGRNAFGEKAETHYIVLERDTAFEQMMDGLLSLDGGKKEFTYDMSCFNGHEDEMAEVIAKVERAMELICSLRRAA